VGLDGGGLLLAAAVVVGPLLVSLVAVVALHVMVAQAGPVIKGQPLGPRRWISGTHEHGRRIGDIDKWGLPRHSRGSGPAGRPRLV